MLSSESLEGLLLIHQKYSNCEEIQLPANIYKLFLDMKEELNFQKSLRQKLKKTYKVREEERKDDDDQEEPNQISQTFKKMKTTPEKMTYFSKEEANEENEHQTITEIAFEKSQVENENTMTAEEDEVKLIQKTQRDK